MDPRARRSQRGFTFTELIVVIAILGILAAFAAPSMSRMLMTQKVRSTSYDVFADLTFARSEAISRGHNVQMRSASGTSNWINGWEIWDTTSNLKLRQQNALASGITFTANDSDLVFDRTGRSSKSVNFTIVPNDPDAIDDQKRCVHIEPSGRPRTSTGAC